MEKVQSMHQVRAKKTNTSEPSFKCRKCSQMTPKPEGDVTLGSAGQLPAYWPGGVRHRDGVSLVRASILNCGNLSLRCIREKRKQRPCQCESIEARHRDGAARSSVEASVMEVERRGGVIWP